MGEGTAIFLRIIAVDLKTKLTTVRGIDGKNDNITHHTLHDVSSQSLLIMVITLELGCEMQLFRKAKLDLSLAIDSAEDGSFLHGLELILGGGVSRSPAGVDTGWEGLRNWGIGLHDQLILTHTSIHTLLSGCFQDLGVDAEPIACSLWWPDCEV